MNIPHKEKMTCDDHVSRSEMRRIHTIKNIPLDQPCHPEKEKREDENPLNEVRRKTNYELPTSDREHPEKVLAETWAKNGGPFAQRHYKPRESKEKREDAGEELYECKCTITDNEIDTHGKFCQLHGWGGTASRAHSAPSGNSTPQPPQAAAEEGGEWEKEFMKEFGGAKVWVPVDGEPRYVQPNYDGYINFIRTLLSRTRKEAEERTWKAAIEIFPKQPGLKTMTAEWKKKLIQAAQSHGVNLEV